MADGAHDRDALGLAMLQSAVWCCMFGVYGTRRVASTVQRRADGTLRTFVVGGVPPKRLEPSADALARVADGALSKGPLQCRDTPDHRREAAPEVAGASERFGAF